MFKVGDRLQWYHYVGIVFSIEPVENTIYMKWDEKPGPLPYFLNFAQINFSPVEEYKHDWMKEGF